VRAIKTSGSFQKGRQSSFLGGGPSLNVAVTDAIYEPLAARRVVAAREANIQAARNLRSWRSARGTSFSRMREAGWLASRQRSGALDDWSISPSAWLRA
jgi:hypothetical protein